METRANYLLIGAFSIAGFLGILGFVLWFANLELNRQFAYYDVYFRDVSGLSISSDVRFAGLSVGQVVDMSIADGADDGDGGAVRVRLEMREGTPVPTDSTAGLVPQGVTGTFAVAVTSGSPDAPLLRPGADDAPPIIPSTRSMLQTLSDEGPELIKRLGQVAEDLSRLVGEENQARVSSILANVERSTGNLDKAIADVSSATGSIAAAAEDIAGFGDQLGGLSDAAKTTLGNVDTAIGRLATSVDKADAMMEAGRGALDTVQGYIASDLTGLTARIDTTAGSIETAMGRFSDTLDVGKGTLGAAERAFNSADQVIGTDIAPVTSDLRVTLGNLDKALARVTEDLPAITGPFRDAAQSASEAFGKIGAMTQNLNGPVQAFARDGLPQFTRMASDMRALISNIDQFVTGLRRNPSQLISGQQKPEFRR